MKRRLVMWIVIVCILIVGVSVTRITEDFVVSNGVEASSILIAMDGPEEGAASRTGGALARGAAGENRAVITEDAADEDVPMEQEAAVQPLNEAEAAMDLESETEKSEAAEETVKSPLDPNVDLGDETELEISEARYNAEDFAERFENVEANSEKLWSNLSVENSVAYYAAAEQERVLWDYELNLIYGEIRKKLSEDEAEELKHLELDWMKERDQYAEKMALKSTAMNVQNQNPVYTRALAEKTRERCYWLLDAYGDVLDQEGFFAEVKE